MAAHQRSVVRRAALALALLAAVAVVRVPAPQASGAPRRIVSLIPAVTEMIFAIGAGPQVVGVGSFDHFPPAVESLPRVGALLDPDLERILSLKPDLVVVYGSQTDLRAQLARAQVPVYSYSHAGLADVMQTIRAVGSRTGHAREGEALARRIEQGLSALRKKVRDLPRPRTLLVFGRERLALRGIYASGGVGFLDDMLEAAGGRNVFADVPHESVQASTELILSRRPEVILEIRAAESALAPGDRAAEIGVWNALPSIPAVRSGRVLFLTDDRLVIPGPRVLEGTALLARALHPEAFR